jgi:Tfp pilus assembly protein PilF
LDPNFAVAYAAWSFTRFQDALQWFRDDRAQVMADVRRLAEKAVELDPMDPFANLSMGRWYWLAGTPEDGLDWCERAIQLSPSHAKSHYSRGFLDAFAGRAQASRASVDTALRLSPLDPLAGAMFAAKGMAYLVEGDAAGAKEWMTRSARKSPTHASVVLGAIAACQLAGDKAQAAHWLSVVRGYLPGATASMYQDVIPLADAAARARVLAALRAAGLPD